MSRQRAGVESHAFGTPRHEDNMAEWLRRQPAKLMGYARVGSNPTVVVFHFLTDIESVFCLYYAPNGSTWKHRTKGLDNPTSTHREPGTKTRTCLLSRTLTYTCSCTHAHTDCLFSVRGDCRNATHTSSTGLDLANKTAFKL